MIFQECGCFERENLVQLNPSILVEKILSSGKEKDGGIFMTSESLWFVFSLRSDSAKEIRLSVRIRGI